MREFLQQLSFQPFDRINIECNIPGGPDVSLLIGLDNGNGSVIGDDIEEKIKVLIGCCRNDPFLCFCQCNHASTFFVGDLFKQDVGEIDQISLAVDGICPYLHVFTFIMADLIYQDIRIVKRDGDNQDGCSEKEPFPAFFPQVDIHKLVFIS